LLLVENNSATATSAEDTVCCNTLSIALEPDTSDTSGVNCSLVEGVVSQSGDITV